MKKVLSFCVLGIAVLVLGVSPALALSLKMIKPQSTPSAAAGPPKVAAPAPGGTYAPLAAPDFSQYSTVMWINHLDFVPGDPSVTTSFNAVNSGVGGGLSGLIINSTTTGETAGGGGNKVVEQGLQVPPGYLVTGVRVCYELTNPGSFISQIRIAQVQDPPAMALVQLDDGTDLVSQGPVCVDSAMPLNPIDPALGALRLNLRVNFGNTLDTIVVRAVGLHLQADPNSPLFQGIQALWEVLENHSHMYLTGRGVGHNNTNAITGPAVSPEPQ